MQKHGVAVNDIYEDSKAIHKAHGIGIGDVHYTEKGSVELGKLIIGFMEKELNRTNPIALSDEKQIQILIQDSFDSLFSAFNEDLILDYYTEDFLLLEQGEIWDIEFIRNYFKKAKSNTSIPSRTNRFEFITTNVEGNRAWVAYQNYATSSRPGQEPSNRHWLESATAVRTAKGWRLEMLHSTRVEE
jgi:ketosteroid isomerase-like protein